MVARSMHRYRHAHHARRCPSARASDATNGRPYAIRSPVLPIRREVGHSWASMSSKIRVCVTQSPTLRWHLEPKTCA